MTQNPRNILIIQPGLIGDCIMTLTLARYLRTLHPRTCVTLAAFAAYSSYLPPRSELTNVVNILDLPLQNLHAKWPDLNPNHIEGIQKHTAPYDHTIAFVHNKFGECTANLFHIIESIGRRQFDSIQFLPDLNWPHHLLLWHLLQLGLGIHSTHPRIVHLLNTTSLDTLPQDHQLADMHLRHARIPAGSNYCILSIGAGVTWKRFHLHNFIELANFLQDSSRNPLYLQGPLDTNISIGDIPTPAQYQIPRIYTDDIPCQLALLKNASLVIANDSGIAHMSAAVGTKTLVIYGPTTPTWYRPVGPQVETFTADNNKFKAPNPEDVCKLKTLLQKLKW